jgi:predicted nucleotidyltransferase component of viral defense system
MLHYKTVSPELLKVIQIVSKADAFAPFRLVGGTALSLYLGHRLSVDADFFTAGHFDKKVIESELVQLFPNIVKVSESLLGYTWAFGSVKMDFYDWKVPFLNPAHSENEMRLASLEDVAAYKLDAVVGRKAEKDYYDIAELMTHFSLVEILTFYRQKFPYNDVRIALDHLSLVAQVPVDNSIAFIKERSQKKMQQIILKSIQAYMEMLYQKQQQQLDDREAQLRQLLAQKKKKKD